MFRPWPAQSSKTLILSLYSETSYWHDTFRTLAYSSRTWPSLLNERLSYSRDYIFSNQHRCLLRFARPLLFNHNILIAAFNVSSASSSAEWMLPFRYPMFNAFSKLSSLSGKPNSNASSYVHSNFAGTMNFYFFNLNYYWIWR